MRVPKYWHYCFDLDGVLVNSIQVMELAWLAVQMECEIDIEFQQFKKHLGIPFRQVLGQLGVDSHLFTCAHRAYNQESRSHIEKIELYPSVPEVLSYLRSFGIYLSILTSKDKLRTAEILDHLSIAHFFDSVTCYDDLPKGYAKPNPASLNFNISKAGLKNSETIFFGDMFSDERCANAAAVDYCHCNYGYGECVHKGVSIDEFQDLMNVFIEK